MKHEWRKHEKELYGVKQEPRKIEVGEQKYIMISGKGNPNNEDFSKKVSALYTLSYAIKMRYKKAPTDNEITDFTVYPLEGVWGLEEGDELIKDNLIYTIMIRQPNFIMVEMFEQALAQVKEKKPNHLYEEITFEATQSETCVEILHLGSFDEEPASFEKMQKFIEEESLERTSLWHREIYLSDPRRTTQEKLKTILRYEVCE